MIQIDEVKAWPIIRKEIQKTAGWTCARLLPKLTIDHQLDAARDWMRSPHPSNWDWDHVVPVIIHIPARREDLQLLFQELRTRLDDYPGKIRTGEEYRTLVDEHLARKEDDV